MMIKDIIIKGARENNLQNIDLVIPKNKLIVMTGVSGSGKSSLAFNTIYAEGQRRYVESLSAYARQFLGNYEKPDVDSIEGLSPAISIDQKTTSHNPRSTVGTVTEIYDYLRLLYARVGVPVCPKHNIVIESKSISAIVNEVFKMKLETKLLILAPIVQMQKGSHEVLLNKLTQDGFIRVKINNQIMRLDETIKLVRTKKHTISIVVDRIILTLEDRSRIFDAIEVATKYSGGLVSIENLDKKEINLFSQNYACKKCSFAIGKLEPRLFSFNSPVGACFDCHGLGVKLEADEHMLIPDHNLTLNQGAVVYYKNIAQTDNIEWQIFQALCNYFAINLDIKITKLSKKDIFNLLRGTNEEVSYKIESKSGNIYNRYEKIEGIGALIERRYIETTSKINREYYKKFMIDKTCPTCDGTRLNPQASSVQVGGINIAQLTVKNIKKTMIFINELEFDDTNKKIADLVLKEIISRLSFLHNVGLSYLTLNRKSMSLSGGEAQRIRLATQIGSKLTGVLYVLDEPSIGLHQHDNGKLIATLKAMRDIGNTLIVVEHDEETIKAADWVIDIGPEAGEAGGKIVAQGPPIEIMQYKKSITGLYLSKQKWIEIPKKRRVGNGHELKIIKASENNLQNIDVVFPLGKIIGITGVSGSGKSTLINQILWKAIHNHVNRSFQVTGKHKTIKGLEFIDRIINISQEPIGRTPRSNPATYTSTFDDIRDIFALTTEAKARGYLKGRFSFNVSGGRCERCQGDGVIKIEMHFLPNVYVTCQECDGKRYNEETLQVTYKNKTISDILNLTCGEALIFFNNHLKLKRKLQMLLDVGLHYIKLGQSAITLSGGEAQRVKLAKELQKKATGKTLYILDEPTTGLHTNDVARLIKVFEKIANHGDTIITIEHNLDIIKICDHIIDLGPEGGDDGGKIIATGTPEKIAKNKKSYTGQYLAKIL